MRIDVSDEIAEHILCVYLSELYFSLKENVSIDGTNDSDDKHLCHCIEQILAWYGEKPWEDYKSMSEIK